MNAVVQHIAMNCINPAKQQQFYTRHLGFRRARVFNEGKPEEFVMLRLGDCCIELFPTGPEASSARGGEQPVGFKHLAFEVPDIRAKVRELQEAGIDMGEIIDCSEFLEGLLVCFFEDPEGNILELMQSWRDEDDR